MARRRSPRCRRRRGHAREVDALGEGMAGQPRRGSVAIGELDQAEVVDRGHQREELLLGHQLAGEALPGAGTGARGRPRPLGHVPRVQRAQERLVRRVVHGLLEVRSAARKRWRSFGSRVSSREGLEPWAASPGTWARTALAAETTGVPIAR
ncbi:MAG: hypothetical protein ACR2OB_00400 [Solirubrobacteraceae bacterium]